MPQRTIQQLLKKAVARHITLYVLRSAHLSYPQMIQLFTPQLERVHTALGFYENMFYTIASMISMKSPDDFTQEQLIDELGLSCDAAVCFSQINTTPRNWSSKLITSPVWSFGMAGLKVPSTVTLSHVLTEKHDADMRSLRRDAQQMIVRLKAAPVACDGLEGAEALYRMHQDKLVFLSTLLGLTDKLLKPDISAVDAIRIVSICADVMANVPIFSHGTSVDIEHYRALLTVGKATPERTEWIEMLHTLCLTDITRVVSDNLHLS